MLDELQELQRLRKYYKSRTTMMVICFLIGMMLGAILLRTWIIYTYGFVAF